MSSGDSGASSLAKAAGAGAIRRVGEVVVTGAVVAAWMGLAEALALWSFRHVPQPDVLLRDTVLGYAALGSITGAVWGVLFETLSRRRARWRRRPFYIASMFVLIGLFQIVLHTHVHWTDLQLVPGSRASLTVTVLEAGPALALLAAVWWICLTRRPPRRPRPVMGRRAAVLAVVPLAAVAALPSLLPLLRARREAGVPNVLLIVLDTTRADRLSTYGYDRPTTPALDRVAAEGLTFSRAYAAAPWTLPSHASIFTGEYPAVHNATWEHQRLDERLPTLAEHLRDHGLRTAAFSRQVWLSDETGLMRGFEQFHDLYWRSSTALTDAWRMAVEKLRAWRGLDDKGAALVTRTFIDWVDRYGDDNFFAFINYVEPHAHYDPPEIWRKRFLDRPDAVAWGRTRQVAVQRHNAGAVEYDDDDLRAFSDLYDGAVAYQDARMGEALGHLRRRGLLDETLVIITADHGENLGDHGLLGHEFCLYDTLLHVPLVVRLPGTVPAGRVEHAVVENRRLWSLISLVLWSDRSREPITAAALAAALRQRDEAGGPVFAELYRRPLTSKLWKQSGRLDELDRRLKSLRLRDMKYIRGSDGREELYDLNADPAERHDLTAQRKEDLAVLRDLLAAKIAAVGTAAGGEAPEFSEALKRRLESLGYLD